MMIVFAKLPVPVSLHAMKSELSQALLNWDAHFNPMNYKGKWTGVVLRSVAGREDSIIPGFTSADVYTDHANLLLFPAIKTFLENLQCTIGSVRLLNLASGSDIKPHRDYELCFEQGEMRLHIPLVTNPEVEFDIHGQRLVMKEGECWYMNANLKHQVSNKGQSDRIHLVIDCQVNHWLSGLINQALVISHAPDHRPEELQHMIRSLRAQQTLSADQLADQLQKQYKQDSKQ